MIAPLHVHSHFSLLRGASSVEDLVRQAKAHRYSALALTDRDALYGAIRFSRLCAEAGIHPVIGAEVSLALGTEPEGTAPPADTRSTPPPTLLLLAENQTGYHNLCRLISRSYVDRPKGKARLPFDALAEHADGLIALSGGRDGEVSRLLLARHRAEAAAAAERYREVFRHRFYLEVQSHHLPSDRWLMGEMVALGRAKDLPLVATTDVHYARPERRALQDVLTCVRTKTTLAQPSPERLPNGHFDLKPPEALRRLFRDLPEALERTADLAERCAVSLDFHHARFPPLDLPPGETPDDALRRLCHAGAQRRYHPPTEQVWRQLEHELAVVQQSGLAPFFLIAADVARRFNGRCRGSAAGSLIVYCLGVSVVDPLRYGMLFERFINPERPTMPDIDVDFSEWDRAAAIAYVYQKYGAERAAMVCNYVRYRSRLAVRDVGKVLGLPPDLVDRIAKSLDHHASIRESLHSTGPDQPDLPSTLVRLCEEIDDFPRHLSVHVGGMLVTGQPLIELFGLEPARKEGIVVVGADKEDVEDANLGKLDLLCLRALSVTQEAERLERARGVPLDLRELDLEDPRIYAMLRRADTVGASQVESRAQMQSVVRTQPRCFRDLMNQCAIIRPGPIVSGMVHPFNRRRLGLEEVVYPHPSLEPILRDTLGIFLFQEQIILGVMALTGCSAGEADVFRRAMGSHRSREAMQRLQPWFLERAQANGIGAPIAAEVFRQISGFADFGFCRSHSAALARTAYEGLYLKRYHPAAFYAALISNQPMGFYPVEVLVWDGVRHGIRFRPVEINRSGERCRLEPNLLADAMGGDHPPLGHALRLPEDRHAQAQPDIRLGFTQVHGVGEEVAKWIVAERERGGTYRSLADFCRRTGLVGKPVEGLVLAGAFLFEGRSREEQLWELYGRTERPGLPALPLSDEVVDLPARSEHDQVLLDHVILGFCLDRHLVVSYRRRLKALGVVTSKELERLANGREARVGGLVVCRQRPGTAKGFVFLTLEDEWGLINVIVRPDVYERYRSVLRDSHLIAVGGRVQKAYGTTNLIATRALAIDPRVADASPREKEIITASVRAHDFR